MRFGLAAKLSLLATVLVLGTATGAGALFYAGARAVVRERELAGLQDEADLRARELRDTLADVPTMLLDLAVAPETRAALAALGRGDEPAPPERDALAALFARRLEAHPACLAVALVRTDPDGRELARAERPRAGGWPQPDRAAEPRRWRGVADLEEARKLAPLAAAYSDVRPPVGLPGRPAGTPALELVVALALQGPEAGRDPPGVLLAQIDFAALTRRLNAAPRRLGFLVNARGQYLAHPDPARLLPAPVPADGNPLDAAFADLYRLTAAGGGPSGLRLDEFALPGAEFVLTNCRFPKPPDRDRLRQIRADLLERHPGLRAGPADDPSGRLTLQAPDADRLRGALGELRQSLGGAAEWDKPYPCASFAAHLVQVRLNADRAGARAAPVGQWFGLAVAAAHEEIEHDIAVNYFKNRRYALLLGGAAGVGALGFATVLTRRLRRMTALAERIAAGQDPEPSLPSGRGRDEIAKLAGAFRSMVEQVRRRTRELRESEARIRTILNTAAEGIVTIDEQGRLQSFNQAAERIFGYPAAEVKGQHFKVLLHRGAPADMATLLGMPNVPGLVESSLYSISRVNGTTREVLARRRDGALFPVEMSVSEVVLGDRLVYTAILRDITERKEAEAQIQRITGELEHRVKERTAELMQANQALESARDLALEANRAKDAFLAVMSHELRTPLNAVIGYCDYWLSEAEELDPEEMRDDLRKMHQSGKHLLALINDILDLAKIQAGKISLDLTDFPVPPLLDELREWVEPLVRRNSNALTVDCAEGLGTMRADRTRVRQVLLNLLSNAAKFTKAGNIRLRAERRAAPGGDELVFRVSDTGVGMRPEDLQRLFRETFFQADTSAARKHEGTGLGLVICKKLCNLMGGDITAQSAVGVGTTFTVRLPAVVPPPELPGARREPPPAADVEPAAPADGPDPVLVIDDDPATRELLCRLLGREGYQVHAAADGAPGLELARKVRPRAIVLDALMPRIDGRSVLAALKADPATADIPVVTATIVDDRTRGFTTGTAEFITKPIDWERLGIILRPYRTAAAGPVLVVEDDPSTRELMVRHLRGGGWEVVEAVDGQSALARLRERRPAVVLLDLLMPGMDGFAFLEALRQEEAGRGVPVVVVTAADLSPEQSARLAGSVQQVLQKGQFTPDRLLAEVRERVHQCVVRRG